MTQKSKDYVDDLLNISDPPDTSNYTSEVAQYYAGRNILITGASGFLGILLIERLLRCCPNIGKIYMFMKEKKQKSAEERFNEHFNCIVYDRLKKEQPDFISKIIMIEANFKEADLGLSPENCKRVLDTNVIFHMAASVRFNNPLRDMINVNARGTKQFLLFAKKMPNLEAFVYVSTVFSNCVYQFIDEKHYIPPLNVDNLLALFDIFDDDTLKKITPTLIDKWPNTYVYSKAIAEDTVRQYSVGLPTCIIRPSIITSTFQEPISGWINNVYGAVGIVAGSALGLLRTMHCVPENVAEIIPADYVIANIIVAAWDTAKRKDTLLSIDNTNSDVPEIERVPVYNCVSSAQNPVTWKRFMKLNEIYGFEVPTIYCIWYYMLILNRYRFIHEICIIFLHKIPGIVFDVLTVLIGRKPQLMKAYKKIETFSDVISYFSTRQWKICDNSVRNLWKSLNPVDREIFNFNMQELCWEEYLKHMIPGLRTYIVKDPMSTLKQGKARYRKLKIAHYTLLTIISILLLWAIISLVKFIISFFL